MIKIDKLKTFWKKLEPFYKKLEVLWDKEFLLKITLILLIIFLLSKLFPYPNTESKVYWGNPGRTGR